MMLLLKVEVNGSIIIDLALYLPDKLPNPRQSYIYSHWVVMERIKTFSYQTEAMVFCELLLSILMNDPVLFLCSKLDPGELSI